MNNSSTSPVTRTYNELKEKYPDYLFLFRVGDYYETFYQDAKIASLILALTLAYSTSEDNMALAGFKYNLLGEYLPNLIRMGHKVAVVEMSGLTEETIKQLKSSADYTYEEVFCN